MSDIRAAGHSLKDPDDDDAFQMLIGDLQRLKQELRMGSYSGAGGSQVGGVIASFGTMARQNADAVDITGGSIVGVTVSGTVTGLGTGDSPQFAGVNVGAPTDTTITRASAGDVNVEGNIIYRAGGTDVAVGDGGTGGSTAATARTNLGVIVNTSAQGLELTGGQTGAPPLTITYSTFSPTTLGAFTSSTTYTIPNNGTYLITFNVAAELTTGGNDDMIAHIYLNGAIATSGYQFINSVTKASIALTLLVRGVSGQTIDTRVTTLTPAGRTLTIFKAAFQVMYLEAP